MPQTFETRGSPPDPVGSREEESEVIVQYAVVSGRDVSFRKVVLFEEYLTRELPSDPKFVLDWIAVAIELPDVFVNLINCLPAIRVEENL